MTPFHEYGNPASLNLLSFLDAHTPEGMNKLENAA